MTLFCHLVRTQDTLQCTDFFYYWFFFLSNFLIVLIFTQLGTEREFKRIVLLHFMIMIKETWQMKTHNPPVWTVSRNCFKASLCIHNTLLFLLIKTKALGFNSCEEVSKCFIMGNGKDVIEFHQQKRWKDKLIRAKLSFCIKTILRTWKVHKKVILFYMYCR